MTTKFLDNEICDFKILLSWRFPTKNSVLDDFPLCPQIPPLKNRENLIFIVVSPSLRDFQFQTSVEVHLRGIALLAGVLRGNTIRGNETRNSERKWHSERVPERGTGTGRPLRGAFCDRFSNTRGPLRGPGETPNLSAPLMPVAPFLFPLDLSPIFLSQDTLVQNPAPQLASDSPSLEPFLIHSGVCRSFSRRLSVLLPLIALPLKSFSTLVRVTSSNLLGPSPLPSTLYSSGSEDGI